MRIPNGPGGVPTVSPSMLRRYGAGGFEIEEQEDPRGCPRQWKAHYVDHTLPKIETEALAFGTAFHETMQRMDDEPIGPEEALALSWPAHLGPELFAEMRRDLQAYLERGTPSDRFATLATEVELTAPLYDDPEFGPVAIRAVLDHIGVDVNEEGVLHATDYKTNRHPPSVEDVRRDVQLKTQAFVVAHNWKQLTGRDTTPQVVMHLDAVKWREVAVRYTAQEIDEWQDWVIAIVRHILRDEDAVPVISAGCAYCPIRDTCPAYEGIADVGESLLAVKPDDREELVAWRDDANRVRLLLDKAVKDVDARFMADAAQLGGMTAGPYSWAMKEDWKTVLRDIRELHTLLGDRFYDVVSVTQTGLSRGTADLPENVQTAAAAMFTRERVGSKMTKEKMKR